MMKDEKMSNYPSVEKAIVEINRFHDQPGFSVERDLVEGENYLAVVVDDTANPVKVRELLDYCLENKLRGKIFWEHISSLDEYYVCETCGDIDEVFTEFEVHFKDGVAYNAYVSIEERSHYDVRIKFCEKLVSEPGDVLTEKDILEKILLIHNGAEERMFFPYKYDGGLRKLIERMVLAVCSGLEVKRM